MHLHRTGLHGVDLRAGDDTDVFVTARDAFNHGKNPIHRFEELGSELKCT